MDSIEKNIKQEQSINRYYPVPADTFEVVGRYIPSYIPVGSIPLEENIYVSPIHKRRTKNLFIVKAVSKIRQYLNNISLKTAFSIYVIAFIFGAVTLSTIIFVLLSLVRQFVSNERTADILLLFSVISIGVIFISGIFISSMLFFKRRLESPLQLLGEASNRIGKKDLDFSLQYSRHDEMGRLVDSFERMRYELERSNNETLRQFEERRRLNSVFSHDLRTPLTVLKGNLQLLSEYLKAQNIDDIRISDSLEAMNNHVIRLENYVEIMSRLQKLEDIQVERVIVNRKEFTELIRSTAQIVCKNVSLRFFDDIPSKELFIDPEIILSVAENLISNASRYAKRMVTVVCSYMNSCFVISVSDDGEGFSEEDLLHASSPFYKANKNVFDTHFGLGLNISKTMTIRHGGMLVIENISAGGALVRAEFSEIDSGI